MRNVIYHNPKCSKSREALGILQEKEIDIEIFEYLKEPIDAQELSYIIERMNCDWKIILRSKENCFEELGLSLNKKRATEEWIKIIQENPTILERPFIVYNDEVVMCRPMENLHKIL